MGRLTIILSSSLLVIVSAFPVCANAMKRIAFGEFSTPFIESRANALANYPGKTLLTNDAFAPFTCQTAEQFQVLLKYVDGQSNTLRNDGCSRLPENTAATLIECDFLIADVCKFVFGNTSNSKQAWTHVLNLTPASAFAMQHFENYNNPKITNFVCSVSKNVDHVLSKSDTPIVVPAKPHPKGWDREIILSIDFENKALSFHSLESFHERSSFNSALKGSYKNILLVDLDNLEAPSIEAVSEILGKFHQGTWGSSIFGFKYPGGFEFRLNNFRNLINDEYGDWWRAQNVVLNCVRQFVVGD